MQLAGRGEGSGGDQIGGSVIRFCPSPYVSADFI
jgi:hypothetical protein